MSEPFPVKLCDFTGRITVVDLDPTSKISLVKDTIVLALKRSSRPALSFKGHELRDHRTLSYYNICKMDSVHMRECALISIMSLLVRNNKCAQVPPSNVDKTILQFERPDGTQFELQVNPHLTVAKLSREIAIEEKMDVHKLKFIPLSDDIDDPETCIISELQELPAEAFISVYPLSGTTVFICGPPPPVAPSASIRVCLQLCDGQRLGVETSLQQTLCEFRGAVLLQHELSITDHVLILASKEVTGEDMPLWDLGFFEDCTVHSRTILNASTRTFIDTSLLFSVPFVLLDIVIEKLTISGLWLHPLTRLSALRQILQYDVPEVADRDEYRFTLDGETFLNESSSLWDADMVSASTIFLRRPARAFFQLTFCSPPSAR
jgi:hypothetical protein